MQSEERKNDYRLFYSSTQTGCTIRSVWRSRHTNRVKTRTTTGHSLSISIRY